VQQFRLRRADAGLLPRAALPAAKARPAERPGAEPPAGKHGAHGRSPKSIFPLEGDLRLGEF
jgi:hypothetical protein